MVSKEVAQASQKKQQEANEQAKAKQDSQIASSKQSMSDNRGYNYSDTSGSSPHGNDPNTGKWSIDPNTGIIEGTVPENVRNEAITRSQNIQNRIREEREAQKQYENKLKSEQSNLRPELVGSKQTMYDNRGYDYSDTTGEILHGADPKSATPDNPKGQWYYDPQSGESFGKVPDKIKTEIKERFDQSDFSNVDNSPLRDVSLSEGFTQTEKIPVDKSFGKTNEEIEFENMLIENKNEIIQKNNKVSVDYWVQEGKKLGFKEVKLKTKDGTQKVSIDDSKLYDFENVLEMSFVNTPEMIQKNKQSRKDQKEFVEFGKQAGYKEIKIKSKDKTEIVPIDQGYRALVNASSDSEISFVNTPEKRAENLQIRKEQKEFVEFGKQTGYKEIKIKSKDKTEIVPIDQGYRALVSASPDSEISFVNTPEIREKNRAIRNEQKEYVKFLKDQGYEYLQVSSKDGGIVVSSVDQGYRNIVDNAVGDATISGVETPNRKDKSIPQDKASQSLYALEKHVDKSKNPVIQYFGAGLVEFGSMLNNANNFMKEKYQYSFNKGKASITEIDVPDQYIGPRSVPQEVLNSPISASVEVALENKNATQNNEKITPTENFASFKQKTDQGFSDAYKLAQSQPLAKTLGQTSVFLLTTIPFESAKVPFQIVSVEKFGGKFITVKNPLMVVKEKLTPKFLVAKDRLGELKYQIAKSTSERNNYLGGSGAIQLQVQKGYARQSNDLDIYVTSKGTPESNQLAVHNEGQILLNVVKNYYAKEGKDPSNIVGTFGKTPRKDGVSEVVNKQMYSIYDKTENSPIVEILIRSKTNNPNVVPDKIINFGGIKARDVKQVVKDKRQVLRAVRKGLSNVTEEKLKKTKEDVSLYEIYQKQLSNFGQKSFKQIDNVKPSEYKFNYVWRGLTWKNKPIIGQQEGKIVFGINYKKIPYETIKAPKRSGYEASLGFGPEKYIFYTDKAIDEQVSRNILSPLAGERAKAWVKAVDEAEMLGVPSNVGKFGKLPIRGLTQKQSDYILNFGAKKQKLKMIDTVHGSTATKPQIAENLQKEAGDVLDLRDVDFKPMGSDPDAVAVKLVEEFKLGFPLEKGQYFKDTKYKIGENKTIELVGLNGKPNKIVEFTLRDTAEEKLGKISKKPIYILSHKLPTEGVVVKDIPLKVHVLGYQLLTNVKQALAYQRFFKPRYEAIKPKNISKDLELTNEPIFDLIGSKGREVKDPVRAYWALRQTAQVRQSHSLFLKSEKIKSLYGFDFSSLPDSSKILLSQTPNEFKTPLHNTILSRSIVGTVIANEQNKNFDKVTEIYDSSINNFNKDLKLGSAKYNDYSIKSPSKVDSKLLSSKGQSIKSSSGSQSFKSLFSKIFSSKSFSSKLLSNKSYSIKSPSSKSYSIKSPSSKSYSVKSSSSKSYSIKSPSNKSYSIKSPSNKSYSIKSPSNKSYSIKSPSSKSYSIKSPSTRPSIVVSPFKKVPPTRRIILPFFKWNKGNKSYKDKSKHTITFRWSVKNPFFKKFSINEGKKRKLEW